MEDNILELFRNEDVRTLCKLLFNEDITPHQEDIVRSVAFDTHKRIVICCMTRYGKSWAVSMGILLWILMNEKKKLVIVAPTVEKTSIIRNYIAYFVAKNPIFIELLDLDRTGSDRIRKEVSKKRMTWKNGIEMRTLSADGKGEQLMGFGADKLIVDETCDIDYEVYRQKISRMLGENPNSSYVEIGNPNHKNNHMWNHWIDPNWEKIHIDWKIALQEGRINKEFLYEQQNLLTEMEFDILYNANFPSDSEDQLIRWEWIEKAFKTKIEITKDENIEIIAGVDVAEQGNDWTVVTIGQKNKLLNKYNIIYIESWCKQDLMPTVGKILPIIEKYKVQKIRIDATGIGSGVYSRLEELSKEGKIKCKIEAFKGGLSPSTNISKERFLNTKAESYWHLRELFEKNKISILDHKELINQLSKMKWEFTSAEKIRIRDPGTKEGDTAEEKSPDFSDSLNICVWEGERIPMIFFGSKW